MEAPRDILTAASLLALWVLLAATIGIGGDFPLNDDWSYSETVRHLAETGEIEFTGWVSMPLIAQIFWGYLFTLPEGFSHVALRLSTLVLAGAAVLSTYGLQRAIGAGPGLAALGCAVLMANPVFFALSFTFMTDVPFLAVFTSAAFCLVLGLRRQSFLLIGTGLALGLISILIRQLGLSLFIGFAFAYPCRNGIGPRSLAISLLSLCAAFGVYFGYGMLLEYLEKTPELYSQKSSSLSDILMTKAGIVRVATNAVTLLGYGGLFLLPVGLICAKGRGAVGWATVVIAFAAMVLLTAGLASGQMQPLIGNVFLLVGCGPAVLAIGPATLRDASILCQEVGTVLPPALPALLIGLGIFSGSAILARLLLPPVRRGLFGEVFRGPDAGRVLLLVTGLAYCLPLLSTVLFDRYLLPLLPLLLALALGQSSTPPKPLRLAAAGLLLLCMAAFSLAGTHDYLAWNTARWQAVNELEGTAGLSPHEIDGGFEYNGLRRYLPGSSSVEGKSWWWVKDDRYLIGYHPQPGYEIQREIGFTTWLPGHAKRILVLERRP